MSGFRRTEYKVQFPAVIGGTEMDDTSGVLDRDEALRFERFITSRGGPAERFRRTVTYGEWEVDSD